METKTPKEFFEASLPERFKPEKSAGIDVIAQIILTGSNGGNWSVTIKNQKMTINQGINPNATLTLEISDSDFLDLVNGKLSAEKAFFSGKAKFKGNIALALRLREAGFL